MATVSNSFLKKPIFPESLFAKAREEKKFDHFHSNNEKSSKRGFSVKDMKNDSGCFKKYKVSDRLIQLAQPRIRSLVKHDLKKKIPNIESLIIFETSPRIIELAKPRKIQSPTNKTIQRIPSRVLKAKATKRTIQLSMPRHNNKIMKLKDKVSSARRFRQFDKKKKKASKDQNQNIVWKSVDADTKRSVKKGGSAAGTLKSISEDSKKIERETKISLSKIIKNPLKKDRIQDKKDVSLQRRTLSENLKSRASKKISKK